MDVNDPFEMRPQWTQEHQDHQTDFRNRLNKMVAGLPIMICTSDGFEPGGPMPYLGEEPNRKVEDEEFIALKPPDSLYSLAYPSLACRRSTWSLIESSRKKHYERKHYTSAHRGFWYRITLGVGEAGVDAIGPEVLQQLLRHLAKQWSLSR